RIAHRGHLTVTARLAPIGNVSRQKPVRAQTAKKKGAVPAPFNFCSWLALSRRGLLAGGLLVLGRAGISSLRVDIAIDEFDHTDRRRVAVTEAGLEHPRIAAVALLVARADDLEQLLDHGHVADFGDRLAAGMQVAALAERHQLLDDRTEVLRLRQGGH